MQAGYKVKHSQFRLRIYKATKTIWMRDIKYSPTDDGLKGRINFYYILQKTKMEIAMQGNALTRVIQKTF